MTFNTGVPEITLVVGLFFVLVFVIIMILSSTLAISTGLESLTKQVFYY